MVGADGVGKRNARRPPLAVQAEDGPDIGKYRLVSPSPAEVAEAVAYRRATSQSRD